MKKNVNIVYPTQEELKKLQNNMLELLIEFDRICRKYKIRYSIDGGTLLGAVRHKGFIPWDCDIDVDILEEDYKYFKEACKKELDSKKFYLQDHLTDKNYRWAYARLLRENTVYTRAGYSHMNVKNGVFIDIFTMENTPDNICIRYIYKFFCALIRKLLWSEAGKKVHPSLFMRGLYNLLSKISKKNIFKFKNIISKIFSKNQKSIYIMSVGAHYSKSCPFGYKRSFFDNLKEYTFENYKFYGYANYDWVLKSLYGDYMKLPSEEERKDNIPCEEFKYTEAEFDSQENE